MKRNIIGALAIGVVTMMMASCEKVSPTGVLLGNTGVDDRVEMSAKYYRNVTKDSRYNVRANVVIADRDYTFLVGSDSHVQRDSNRMAEMCKIALDNGDALMAHLGDIADTKAEYYMTLKRTLFMATVEKMEKEGDVFDRNDDGSLYLTDDWCAFYKDHYFDEDRMLDIDDIDIKGSLDFYPVVGNHDITHNGWALFSNIFGSSFYDVYVVLNPEEDGPTEFDHFIFLDSANGTLGQKQVEYIDELTENPLLLGVDKSRIRNTFVFTHSNLFRPVTNQFSSTYPREERYYLFNKFQEWGVNAVYMGHVHAWDERDFGGVHYVTMAAMSSENNPEPGEYLMRTHCHADGSITYERVKMNYTPNKK